MDYLQHNRNVDFVYLFFQRQAKISKNFHSIVFLNLMSGKSIWKIIKHGR